MLETQSFEVMTGTSTSGWPTTRFTKALVFATEAIRKRERERAFWKGGER